MLSCVTATKRMRGRALILIGSLVLPMAAYSQSLLDLDKDVQLRYREAVMQLRQSTLHLRDARLDSCRRGSRIDCELAALSETEVTLLDIQELHASDRSEAGKKIKRLADEAGDSVSKLVDAIKALE